MPPLPSITFWPFSHFFLPTLYHLSKCADQPTFFSPQPFPQSCLPVPRLSVKSSVLWGHSFQCGHFKLSSSTTVIFFTSLPQPLVRFVSSICCELAHQDILIHIPKLILSSSHKPAPATVVLSKWHFWSVLTITLGKAVPPLGCYQQWTHHNFSHPVHPSSLQVLVWFLNMTQVYPLLPNSAATSLVQTTIMMWPIAWQPELL